ncbi:hypothetical protein [Fimbriiglobus ruber]|uniref:hypothetical protein n=1 Tax=Fimbriiglobus ruber TaxID=1908690 RepID=UPI00117A5DE5|nr:hypothetical protein [Fimbriiglobus ruber]
MRGSCLPGSRPASRGSEGAPRSSSACPVAEARRAAVPVSRWRAGPPAARLFLVAFTGGFLMFLLRWLLLLLALSSGRRSSDGAQ